MTPQRRCSPLKKNPFGEPRRTSFVSAADVSAAAAMVTDDRNAALRAAVEAFRSEFPRITPACDRVRLARTGWVTVVGGLAYYQDYVFYDALGHVLIAYRTFLQRSGD